MSPPRVPKESPLRSLSTTSAPPYKWLLRNLKGPFALDMVEAPLEADGRWNRIGARGNRLISCDHSNERVLTGATR